MVRFKRRLSNYALILLIILILLSSGCVQQELDIEKLKVHFISMRFGDSILIETPTDEKILIDGGNSVDSLNYLKSKGIDRIDVAIATHQHNDHIIGLWRIIADPNIDVKQFYHNGDIRSIFYKQIFNLVKTHPTLKTGDKLKFDDVILEVLWPPFNNLEALNENSINDNSIVLKLTYHNISFLFTGDCESNCEQDLIQRYDLNSTILKAGHHGVETSSTPDFLKKVNPELIVIPGHAAEEWPYDGNRFIEDLKGVRILNTKEVGNIVITTDGKSYEIDTTRPIFKNYEDTLLNSLEPISFNYTKDRKNYTVELYSYLLPVMNWIRESTPKQAVFLNWWDYGHMIRGIGERETVIFAPSREILYTVSKYARLSKEELSKVKCPECNPHEKIMDVVNALITDDPDKTKHIMKKYNSEYILVTENDKTTSYTLFLIAGYSPSTYLDKNYKPKENAMKFVLFKMIGGKYIEGFEKIYSDKTAKIYKIKTK